MSRMNKIKYLIDFLSESEKNVFDKFYPNEECLKKNIKHALFQVENTLNGRVKKTEEQKEEIKKLNEELRDKQKEVDDLNLKIRQLSDNVAELKVKQRLSNAQDNDQEDVSMWDDPVFFDCLIRAGVDNWDGFDFAVEDYESRLGEDK